MPNHLALISVSDRSGLEDFARILVSCGYTLLATSGSSKYLSSHGIETLPIETYTGQKEILDGRVKTLHPKIHAGLLARRDNPQHMRELTEQGILPIDIAVVNLYPFSEALGSNSSTQPSKMVELIDIGGPTMIRAAAKNFSGVVPIIDPVDYNRIGEYLTADKDSQGGALAVPLEFRQELAVKVFAALAQYNLDIARYFSHANVASDDLVAERQAGEAAIEGVIVERAQILRYGENPHQRGGYYRKLNAREPAWRQLQGKELSYNNLLDFDAALRVIRSFHEAKPAAAILKHLNPCGAALAESLPEALRRAKLGDPRSHFGGVLAFNKEICQTTADAIAEDFAEIVLAPAYTKEALETFQRKKNLRVIEVDLSTRERFELRSVRGGYLIQDSDSGASRVSNGKVVSKRKASDSELRDLQFAWDLCAHVKSNAITIVKGEMLLASGAGQTSRIDAVEVALHKCKVHGHILEGATAASDAFFPFSDCLEALSAAGVKAIVAPHGAKRDADVIAASDSLGITLIFVDDRHFRH